MSYLFIILAAICNATMDTLAHHFTSSIFKDYDPNFWNPNVSWQYAKFLPHTKYRLDAWHLSKSLMIIFLCLAIVFYKSFIHISFNHLIDFILLGCVWNITFNYFYDIILRDA